MRLLATFFAQFWTFLKVIWGDSTFAGKDFIAQIAQDFGWQLEHLKRTDEQPGFTVIPKRWVVERTYSWWVCWTNGAKGIIEIQEIGGKTMYWYLDRLLNRPLAN